MKMKAKTFGLLCIFATILFVSLGFASAAMNFNPASLSGSGNQGTTISINFVINNTATQNMTAITSYIVALTSGSNTLAASNLSLVGVPDYLEGLDNDSITLEVVIPSAQATGTYTGNLTFEGTYTIATNYTVPVSIVVSSNSSSDEFNFCGFERDTNVSNPGDLKLKIDNVNNNGIGQDDEWYPADEIEVEVIVENDGDDDIDNVVVEWGLWSEETDEWVIEMQEEEDFNLNDGEEETVTFTFDLYDDLDIDFDELEDGDYILYVRATGDVDDASDSETCIYKTEKVSIIVEDDYVVLNDIKVTGTPLCGNTIQITADIFNIGEDDQEDVYILISNSELGINQKAEVGDIDAFDDKKLNFEFTIPSNAQEKKYSINLEVYDEDGDIYENSDNDESQYYLTLDVSGNCNRVPNAVVYASLESGGKAGQELKIKATVTNNADLKDTFTISASDYSSWAELVSIEPSSLTLNSDESKDVMITLKVDSDAKENQNLNIVLTSSDGESITQPVAVTIEQGFSFSGLLGDNAYLWGIAIVNIVLIIIIIIVALKVTRR
ncbi:MAG TPA: putative S-layer protein [Candidatus Nanoarchaeia archaeon]|nr:putative S-layer protein [Candidatus Nanoarchaeia archaeon]